MKRLAIALTGAVGLLLAVALAPAIPARLPDGVPTAAAQNVPNDNASCVGLFSSILGRQQLRDDASVFVRLIAEFLGVPPGRVYASVAQLRADSLECQFILSILTLP
jgi:hypothetical protein